MITHVLLYQLRDRLRVVEARIATAATEQPDRAGHYLFAGGQLLKSGGRMQPGYYSLAHSATCPYCGGSGKLTTKDTVRR